MAYEINSRCNSCGKCVSACSMDAIRKGWFSGYKIDPDLCDSCGACKWHCPQKAIVPD
ncbi:MAG: 4Fe-4S binding protein [Clostridiales bacterium]|nr:4Fe-4S binding protein [Clostridiales bacterium]